MGASILYVLITLFLVVPFYILALANYHGQAQTWVMDAVIVWAVIFGFVVLINFIAFAFATKLRLRSVREGTNLAGASSTASTSNTEVAKMLKRIQYTSGQLFVVSILIIILISFLYGFAAR